jgi:hypothetical protein
MFAYIVLYFSLYVAVITALALGINASEDRI